jgi:hypothetical protein
VEHLVDLDDAAAEIERRRPVWAQQAVRLLATTWRDASEPWPQQLRADRMDVTDPDSLGIHLQYGNSEVFIVLFRGGWADVTFWRPAQEPIMDAPKIPDVPTYGAVVDQFVAKLIESS